MITIPNDEQAAFITCVFSLLGKMVACDGVSNKNEERAVAEFIVDKLDFCGTRKSLALEVFGKSMVSPLSFADYARSFNQHFGDREDLRLLVLEILWKIAIADSRISPKETKLIEVAGQEFNIEPERVEAICSRGDVNDKEISLEGYYKILGCSAKSSDREIRDAYKRIVGRLAKDQLASRGVPEEFHFLVELNLENVEKAYSEIKANRNIADYDD